MGVQLAIGAEEPGIRRRGASANMDGAAFAG